MQAGTYNINCDQGSTFSVVMTLTDAAGDPYDLTGYAARMHVRRDYDSPTTIVELSTGNGRISLDETIGQITLSMDAATTAAINSSGVYDIEIVSSTGEVYRPLKGKFVLIKEVTR